MILKYLFGLHFRDGLESFIQELNAKDPNIEIKYLTPNDDVAFHMRSSQGGARNARKYEIKIGYLGSDVKFLLMALSHKLLENSGLISAESYQMGDWWSMQYKFMNSSTIAMTYEYKEGITEIKLFDKDIMQKLEEMVLRHANEQSNENKNRLEL
jgi:hypothetical protein